MLPTPSSEMVEVTHPDWTGLTVRVADCLGLQRALQLLDSPGEGLTKVAAAFRRTTSNGA